ncbi:membrane protein insertion efficiency factor YidD [Campylobacter majalis]
MFKVRDILLTFIKFYQNYISKLLPNSCRYYPSCSEYAIWQFKTNSVFLAMIAVFMRILRCNQLFKGGIDYPIIRKNFHSAYFLNKHFIQDIDFWFVPVKNGKFYVIKNYKDTKNG